jgi:hypothetical protein
MLQIDVSGASVFGWFQSFSPFGSGGGISESCLQSTDPGREVVPATLYTLFVLAPRKLSMRICAVAPFHLSSAYLHSGAIPLSAGPRQLLVCALKRSMAANLVRNVQPGSTTPRLAVMLQLRFEKSLPYMNGPCIVQPKLVQIGHSHNT